MQDLSQADNGSKMEVAASQDKLIPTKEEPTPAVKNDTSPSSNVTEAEKASPEPEAEASKSDSVQKEIVKEEAPKESANNADEKPVEKTSEPVAKPDELTTPVQSADKKEEDESNNVKQPSPEANSN